MTDLDQSYPSIADLRARARRRLPRFVWDFFDSATGTEAAHHGNHAALDRVRFNPSILFGPLDFDLSATLLDRTWALPFGIAPVGMSGLAWPGAEVTLARLGAERNIPYCLSTAAAMTPEEVGPATKGEGWFQLYAPRDLKIREDMLKRARAAGFRVLVLTVDVPFASRRERQRRGGLTNPPGLTPRIALQCALRPAWSLATLRNGVPRMKFIEDYTGKSEAKSSTAHVGYLMRTAPSWDYVHHAREVWDGPLVVKGVLVPEDAVALRDAGVDAVWVSNHGGRQFEAAPPAIEVLPRVRAAVGPDYPLIFDSGIRSGIDILRALALGADFCFLGRGFHYGLAAFGARGAAHVVDLLEDDLKANLGQLGLAGIDGLSARLLRDDVAGPD